MQAQRTRDTAPEVALRRELHRRGFRFRIDRRIVPDQPRRRVDIVFGPAKVAVFVDGCFWHGCRQHNPRLPKVNEWYWPAKMARNRARDADSDDRLTAAGWLVVRVWEHEPLNQAADRVESALRPRRERPSASD